MSGFIRKRDRWLQWEDELLVQLWASGTPTLEIATRFTGRSKNSIIGRAHRLGLEQRTNPRGKPIKPMWGEVAPEIVSNEPCIRCGVRGECHTDAGCRSYLKAA